MPKNAALILVAGALCLAATLAPTKAVAAVVSQQRAQGAGLVRAWFTQAPLDRTTQRVVGARLYRGVLYVLTSGGVLQSLDPETGVTRWTVRVGDGSLPSYGPSVHHTTRENSEGEVTELTKVGVVTGSTLHVLKAENGAEILAHKTGGAPATAPAITADHAFVPVVGGRLIGHQFDQLKKVPIVIASPGTLLDEPVLSENRIIWSTTDGQLYGADPKTGVPAFRFDATAPLSGTPYLVDQTMYFANTTGSIYAMTADRARPLWKSSVGLSVRKPVVVIGDTVLVSCETPTLYAFDSNDGHERWRVDGLGEFVSASEKHFYAINPGGALGVLDRTTGEPLRSWPAVGRLSPIRNTETDRLYFVSEAGLIQCFHEEGLDEPYSHLALAEAGPADAATDPAAEDTPVEEDPFGAEPEAPAEPDTPIDDPFGGFGVGEEEESTDDPFGAFE